MGKRRKVEEIIDALFKALPVNSTLPLTTVAHRADCSFEVTQRYMALILDIQSRPKVHEEAIGQQKGYRKHTRAGRPSKE